MKMGTIGDEFIAQSVLRIRESQSRIQSCLAELPEAQLWQRPNQSSNSVGNLVLHLIGNVTQWIQSGLGGKEDARVRAAEFAAQGGHAKDALAAKIDATIEAALATIQAAGEDELMRSRKVQGFSFSGLGIIVHVTEHLSYHTGQIAFWIKLLGDKDLGFYRGRDLNARD